MSDKPLFKHNTNKQVAAIDAEQFFAALKDYAEVGHKDFAGAINRKTRDAFLRASREAPYAAKARIRAKYKGQYAYFSKMAYNARGGALTPYTRTVTEKLPNGKTRTRTRTRFHVFSNQDRTDLYNVVLRRTLAHVGFIRAYLKSCADTINTVCNLNSSRPARLVGDSAFTCTVKPATPDHLNMTVDARYGYLKKQGSGATVDHILDDSLGRGFAIVEADTRAYIEKKLSENAKAHSAA